MPLSHASPCPRGLLPHVLMWCHTTARGNLAVRFHVEAVKIWFGLHQAALKHLQRDVGSICGLTDTRRAQVV